tara:strand:- start:1804 stop:2013 length:210 start_codon:yes stop_codon:yes gene_type:complete
MLLVSQFQSPKNRSTKKYEEVNLSNIRTQMMFLVDLPKNEKPAEGSQALHLVKAVAEVADKCTQAMLTS